jgi:hypothetical protein
VLAILGGLLGVLAGYVMLQGLVAVTPPHVLPAEADVRLNTPVLLSMLGATTGSALATSGLRGRLDV